MVAVATTLLPYLATGAAVYSAYESSEAQKRQADFMRKQQETEKGLIAEEKAKQLKERKIKIDEQRRQLYGAGDQQSPYSIGMTSDVGVVEKAITQQTGTLIGQPLGA